MAASDRCATAATEAGEALYLYCLARAGELAAIEGPGVDAEHSLELISFEDIVAVISRVRVDDFSGPSAEARMKDLAWIGSRVCRHHEAVERARGRSAVVPAPFAVLFSSPERLGAWLCAHRDAVSRALDRFASHEEWSVKGALDRPKGEARLLSETLAHQGGEPASVGARYLREQRIRVTIGRKLDAWLDEACAGILRALLEHAAEFRGREIVGGASEENGTPVANWAFLVARSAVDEFAARVESINTEYAWQGLTLKLSGPWPPYSFCPPLGPGPSA